MLKIRLAADTGPISGEFRQTLGRIRELSLEGVELDLIGLMPLEEYTRTAVREIRKLLADAGLPLVLARLRLERGLDDPENLEMRVEYVRRAMELAYQLGGKYLSYRIGYVPQEVDSIEAQVLKEILRDLCRWGERCGAVLVMETGWEPAENVLKLLEGFPQGGIGVEVNPAEFALHGYNPVGAVEILGQRILAFHAGDATSRPGGKGYKVVPLGRGNIDYPAVLSALENAGYGGHIILRPTGEGDPIEELRESKEFIYRL